MSARAPFVPRPASRVDAPATENAQQQPSPSAEYEAFRPNGLLPPTSNTLSAGEHATHNGPDSKYKPLNLSGFSKVKGSPSSVRLSKPRSSVDGSNRPTRSPKPFAPAHQKHLAAPRPTSPFFPNSGLVSMNGFRPPPPPAQPHQQPGKDELSSNKAHIVSSAANPDFGDHHDLSVSTHPPADAFRYYDPSAPVHRAHTASHPSLESIHEVDEELDDHGSPQKIGAMAPPQPQHGAEDPYAGNFPSDFGDASHVDDVQYSQSLRRTTKRLERTVEDDEFEYGTGAKRYKMAAQQDDYAMPFGGRATPARYPNGGYERTATPAQGTPLLQSHGSRKVAGDDGSKQALYRLLGQDLDICVEANLDAYEQAKKKWSECSMEEWTKGADDIGVSFAKLLDFVKDHMTAKLSLYANLHNTITEHRSVLSNREVTLNEAKESLLREGGAVVGGTAKTAPENEA